MSDTSFWNPPPIKADVEYIPEPIPPNSGAWIGGEPTRLGYWWIARREARRALRNTMREVT